MRNIHEIVSQKTLNKLAKSTVNYYTLGGALTPKGYKRALKVALNEAYQKGRDDENRIAHRFLDLKEQAKQYEAIW